LRRKINFTFPGLRRILNKRPKFDNDLNFIVNNFHYDNDTIQLLDNDPSCANVLYIVHKCWSWNHEIALSLVHSTRHHRGWLRRRMLIYLAREYRIPEFIVDYAVKTIGQGNAVPALLLKDATLQQRFINEARASCGTLLDDHEIHTFLYDPELLNKINRSSHKCAHTDIFAACDRYFPEGHGVELVGAFRVDWRRPNPEQWTLVKEQGLNGVSLPLIRSTDTVDFPLVLVMRIPVGDVNALDVATNLRYGVWNLIYSTQACSSRMLDAHDDYDYGLRRCYTSTTKIVYNGLVITRSLKWNKINKLFVLKVYDALVWKEREKVRQIVNIGRKHINKILGLDLNKKNDNSVI